jgi:ribosomal protein L40E
MSKLKNPISKRLCPRCGAIALTPYQNGQCDKCILRNLRVKKS